jgi:hypothetical protein
MKEALEQSTAHAERGHADAQQIIFLLGEIRDRLPVRPDESDEPRRH